MPKTIRTLGSQLGMAAAGALLALGLTGGGLAFAQEAPSAGAGVAETLAGANTVNGAAVINNSLGRADLKVGSIPLWARVRSDGTLINGKGVTGASSLGGGAYQVDFARTITGCGWYATATDNDASSAAGGYATAERRISNDVDSLEIRTFNTAGTQAIRGADDGFAVMVTC